MKIVLSLVCHLFLLQLAYLYSLWSVSAPPSYNESVFGKVNVKDEDDSEHTRGDLDYAPVYTYYDWGHHPTPMSGDGKQ